MFSTRSRREKRLALLFRRTAINTRPYRRHERVQDADGESRTARERLGKVQLGVRIVVVVLVQKLHVAVIDQFGDHRYVRAVHRTPSLQHYGPAGAVQTVRVELFGRRGLVCGRKRTMIITFRRRSRFERTTT